MYACIQWLSNDDNYYITFVRNEDGSIKIFETVEQADAYANKIDPNCENMRVISLDGVCE